MPTLVCVPITVRDIHQALDDARAAKAAGADLAEFRIDEYFSGEPDSIPAAAELLATLVTDAPLPSIVTCRSATEGGAYDGPEESRIALYEHLGRAESSGQLPPRYLDIEADHYLRSANLRMKVDLAVDHPARTRAASPSLILSMHDFTGRPADLSRRLLRMSQCPAADVLKVAFRARSLRDSIEILDLPASTGRPTIALGMGEFGLISRVLAPKFGGFLTFAALTPAAATAPGQPTVDELLNRYRFRTINPRTRVFGVVGWPVGHSLSPRIHNAAFAGLNLDAVYLPLPIAAPDAPNAAGSYESFKATLLELIDHPRLSFSGCSVTLPHKENLVALARERGWTCDHLSLACNAANTLIIERDADDRPMSIQVLNTDGPAARSALEAVIGPVRDRTIAILGAGGVARGIAAELFHAGAKVLIANRSPHRALALAQTIDPSNEGRIAPINPEELHARTPDAIINGTPVGMKGGPDPDSSPIDLRAWKHHPAAVMDTVYNPVRTPLIAQAHSLNIPAIDGVGMFVRQAALQFHAWTQRPAPEDIFERLVRDELARRESPEPQSEP